MFFVRTAHWPLPAFSIKVLKYHFNCFTYRNVQALYISDDDVNPANRQFKVKDLQHCVIIITAIYPPISPMCITHIRVRQESSRELHPCSICIFLVEFLLEYPREEIRVKIRVEFLGYSGKYPRKISVNVFTDFLCCTRIFAVIDTLIRSGTNANQSDIWVRYLLLVPYAYFL